MWRPTTEKSEDTTILTVDGYPACLGSNAESPSHRVTESLSSIRKEHLSSSPRSGGRGPAVHADAAGERTGLVMADERHHLLPSYFLRPDAQSHFPSMLQRPHQ